MMKKLQVVIWLGFMTLLTHGLSKTGNHDWGNEDWVQIDCGAISNETLKELNISTWRLDEEFIKTGQNMLMSMKTTPPQMNSLRFFPEGNKNCYKLSLNTNWGYLLRAGFHYGNYDGLSKPPTFDLEFDGNQWATVVTTLSEEPIFHEVYYTPMRRKVEVCLVRRNTDEGGSGVPFISSLEATHTPFGLDGTANKNKTTFYLQTRNRFGFNHQVGGLDAPGVDIGNRIWKPKSMPDYINLVPLSYPNEELSGADYYPPSEVVSFAIQAPNLSSSITMTVDFSSKVPLSAFFIFYFARVFILPPPKGGNGRIQVFIDGRDKGVVDISDTLRNVTVLTVYPVTVVGSANVTISAAENTTVPALINAMEVYTAIEVQGSQGRNVALNWLQLVFFVLSPLLVIIPFCWNIQMVLLS